MSRMGHRLERRIYIRTHPRSHQAVKQLVAALAISEGCRFEGHAITQEALTNALWLMAQSWSVERVEAEVGPFIRMLDELVADCDEEDEVIASAAATAPGPGPGPRRLPVNHILEPTLEARTPPPPPPLRRLARPPIPHRSGGGTPSR
jgi:hypothetical protein